MRKRLTTYPNLRCRFGYLTAVLLAVAAFNTSVAIEDVAHAEEVAGKAAPQPDEIKAPILRLLRTAIIVKDLDKSRAYYETLGFKAEGGFDNSRNPAGNPFPLSSPSTRSRLLILSDGALSGARIGLVEFSGPSPTDNRLSLAHVAIGNPVFVLDVADADALYRSLRARGVDFIEPPQVYLSKQLDEDGKPMRGKVFHAWDPDGYLIEFLQAPSKFK